MKLIIVRHGETEENKLKIIQGHSPGKLTARGLAENRRLAEKLAGQKVDHIYTSDLARAFDTAKQIHAHHPHIEIKIDPLIRERCYGSAQRKTYGECGFDGVPEMTWTPEGGESLEEMVERAERFLKRLLEEHDEKETVMVVSHGLMIMALVSKLLKEEFGEVKDKLPRNSSAVVLNLEKEEAKLLEEIFHS